MLSKLRIHSIIASALAFKPKCKCYGSGYVCETHPDQPWGGHAFEVHQCHGAGRPCICNPLHKEVAHD